MLEGWVCPICKIGVSPYSSFCPKCYTPAYEIRFTDAQEFRRPIGSDMSNKYIDPKKVNNC